MTLVWSITSGKRLLLVDGQEVHYSNNRGNVFDFSWTMRGNHVLKVVAHASPPLSVQPGFRQYDFFVNGQSFFHLPKVFRLGLAPNDPRGAVPRPAYGIGEQGYGGGGFDMAPRGSTNRRSSSDNIASLEAPKDQEEVRMVVVLSLFFLTSHFLMPLYRLTVIGGSLL